MAGNVEFQKSQSSLSDYFVNRVWRGEKLALATGPAPAPAPVAVQTGLNWASKRSLIPTTRINAGSRNKLFHEQFPLNICIIINILQDMYLYYVIILMKSQ